MDFKGGSEEMDDIQQLKELAALTQGQIAQLTDKLRDLELSALKFCELKIGTRVSRNEGGRAVLAEIRDVQAHFEKDGKVAFSFYGRIVKKDGELSNKAIRLWGHSNWKVVNGGSIYEYQYA